MINQRHVHMHKMKNWKWIILKWKKHCSPYITLYWRLVFRVLAWYTQMHLLLRLELHWDHLFLARPFLRHLFRCRSFSTQIVSAPIWCSLTVQLFRVTVWVGQRAPNWRKKGPRRKVVDPATRPLYTSWEIILLRQWFYVRTQSSNLGTSYTKKINYTIDFKQFPPFYSIRFRLDAKWNESGMMSNYTKWNQLGIFLWKGKTCEKQKTCQKRSD